MQASTALHGSRGRDDHAPNDARKGDRSELVLAFARVLHVSGQSTSDTVSAAERLGNELGLSTTIFPGWGELQLQATDGTVRQVSAATGDPIGVAMNRVAFAMRAIDELAAGRLERSRLAETIDAIASVPPAPTWLFTIAAAAGAAALSIIFGVEHVSSVLLIVASAAAGAILRRTVARYSTNALVQPLCAALLAGLVGGVAVRYRLSSSLRLVAVCPCMILVPGPHVLNGMMDLIETRVSLGTSRVIYAGLIVLAISAGLLLGLAVLNVSLSTDPPARPVPLWLDVVAAGVAVGSYSVFFSTPLRMLAWPVCVGMLAHALRWWTLAAGAGATAGALVACLVAGLILAPISRSAHMPYAAIGFASVVSMIPGVNLFRMASGLEQLSTNVNTTLPLLSATISNGINAVNIILAMSVGVVAPKIVIDWIRECRASRTVGARP